MAITLIRAGAASQSAGATTLTPAKPTVDGSNGRLLAVLCSKNNATHSSTTNGWSKLDQVNPGASFTVSLWEAAEGASSPVITWTGSVACLAAVWYFADASAPMTALKVGSAANTGTSNPHTSSSYNSDANNVLAIDVDAGAAATALTLPSGWGSANNKTGATAAAAISVCTKAIATSGTATGSTSTNGASAAWAQWQLEAEYLATTGSLAKTLGDATLSANGQLALSGTLSKTLADATLSSSAQLAISASLAGTLGGVTLSSAAQLAITGAVTTGLADATLASSGALALAGSLSGGLGDVSFSASGALAIGGTLAGLLDDITLTSTTELSAPPILGDLSATLDDLVVSANAALAISARINATLGGLTLAGDGTLTDRSAALSARLDDVFVGRSETAGRGHTLLDTRAWRKGRSALLPIR